MSKPAFPQTPDGVTDWEKVFEDPSDGLIPLIAGAPNAEVLRSCMLTVILQLYTRKDDELEIARLSNQIERMFAAAPGGMPTENAVALLRSIKAQRVQKAQRYLANKNKQKALRDRRSKTFGARVERIIYLMFKRPLLLGTVASAMFLLAVHMFYVPLDDFAARMLYEPPVPEVEGVAETRTTPEKKKSEEREKLEKQLRAAKVAGRKPRDEDDPPPPSILFQHLALPRPFNAPAEANRLIMPVAELTDKSALRDVCNLAPVIYHTVNVAFSDALAADSDFTQADLDGMAEDIQARMNAELEEPLIARFRLLPVTDRWVYAKSDCQLAPSGMVERLDSLENPPE